MRLTAKSHGEELKNADIGSGPVYGPLFLRPGSRRGRHENKVLNATRCGAIMRNVDVLWKCVLRDRVPH